jgi:hypothetical protein
MECEGSMNALAEGNNEDETLVQENGNTVSATVTKDIRQIHIDSLERFFNEIHSDHIFRALSPADLETRLERLRHHFDLWKRKMSRSNKIIEKKRTSFCEPGKSIYERHQ